MNLYLVGRDIIYTPSNHEVQDTFLTVLDEIVHIMTTVPRLFEKFALPAGGLKRFCDVIQNDSDCNKLQALVDNEIEYNIGLIQDHIEMWDPYTHIWKVDKDAFMIKYREEGHTAADVEKTFPPITDQMITLAKFEVEVGSDMKERHENIPVLWAEYLVVLEEAKKALEMNKDKFKTELLVQAEEFKEAAKEFCEDFYKEAPTASDISVNLDLQRMEKELEKLEEVWGLVFQWEESWDKYKTQTFWEMETDAMEENVMFLFRNFNRLSRQLKEKGWDIIDTTRIKVDEFRRTLPLIGDLKNPCMRERHWDRIKVLMNVEFDQTSEDFKLEIIMRLNFQAYAEDIAEISNAATMELNIENGLKAIREVWKNTTFEMEQHKGDMYKIKTIDEVMQFLEDHQVMLSSMKSTKYVEPFIKDVDYWEKALGYVAECLEISLQVQRRYLYLENIFSGEDIRKQLPVEVVIFDKLTADWTDITFNMHAGTNAIEACMYKPMPYVYNKLNGMVDNLDEILRALEMYLETKRMLFPRFYFISNDDMLEILGNSNKPKLIQVHLKKLFDNVVKIRIDKKEVISFIDSRERQKYNIRCDYNLLNLKHERSTREYYDAYQERYASARHKSLFVSSCYKALYAHDWDRLLYILKRVPRWRFQSMHTFHMRYLHMVWGCRSDQDKKAIQKTLLSLCKRIIVMLTEQSALSFQNAMGLPIAKAMMSEDGECVEWKYNLILDGPAEVWLLGLEHTMRVVLREIQWTSDCTRTLCRCEMMKEKKPMKKLRKKQNQILSTLQMMSRKDISKILRCKVNALCVIEIHSRDMVDKMYKTGCMSVTAFEWFSQLKFYWDREREDCYIRQTNTSSIYTYECYITLTTALHLFRGGSPQGPAGTGKTETTKDLGRALARWVVVTNCSDGLDYKAMAKCYAGIAQSGCWGCFDEFNRINIEVLSVVAQQILALLLALSQFLKKFWFEGYEIKLDANCGIFITMNPGLDIFPNVETPVLDYEMLETAISAEMRKAGLQPMRAALLKVIQTFETKSPDQKWIIFDSPVDAIWIENLNSVMDDNKLLTLVNSERINMPAQTLDLAVASPATVSRNGMVYNDYKDWGWWPYANSWLETVDDLEYREMLIRVQCVALSVLLAGHGVLVGAPTGVGKTFLIQGTLAYLDPTKDRDWFMNHVSDILGKHFELTFHALCPTKAAPIFGHFLNPFEIYDDLNDPVALRKYLFEGGSGRQSLTRVASYICECNSFQIVVTKTYSVKDLREDLKSLTRVASYICECNSFQIVVTKTYSVKDLSEDLKSLTRVASYICECNSFQIVVTKTYSVKDLREDLKFIYTTTGVDTKKTTFIFSDTQIVEETFTEIINNLLSSGEVTNLFKPDEFEDIKSALEKAMKAANIMQTAEQVYLFLVDRVRANLHIVLCFSPIGEEFR
ncbi:putative 1-beta dynein [Operophtera brumata]|uniref:Putative 1-beta dynein n=1 Tax=Operophtera brumata TaxID=104452 RepID=A0A0L7LI11_OPEBR|nr:putative 1-beta dynein [Operophtera brumata]